jgi:hypothetical protein
MANIDDYLERHQIITKAIWEANKQAEPMDFKGSPYIPVHERVKAFRKVFPFGVITTDVKIENGVCTCTAQIFVRACDISPNAEKPEEPVLIATGTAVEKEGSSYINKTSFTENGESSAVGRALGFCGFGIDTAIASADEVQNAELQDISKQKVDGLKVKALTTRCAKDGVDVDKLLAVCKVKSFEDLTEKAFSNVWQNWDKVVALGGKHE